METTSTIAFLLYSSDGLRGAAVGACRRAKQLTRANHTYGSGAIMTLLHESAEVGTGLVLMLKNFNMIV